MNCILMQRSIYLKKISHNKDKIKIKGGDYKMKFVKGMVIGTLLSAGVAVMYTEAMKGSRRKMMRKGKQLVKKLGIL